MSNQTFNFKAFLEESKETLLNPAGYFASMKTAGGLTEPLIKAALYGVVAGVFSFLWSILHLTATTGGLFGGAIGIMAFFWSVIGAVIAMIIGAVIILILSAIAGGNTDFEASARVSAAILVLLPVIIFLGFVSGIGRTPGLIVNLIVNLYGLLMLYYALTKTLKGKENTSKVLTGILAAIVVIFMISCAQHTQDCKKIHGSVRESNEQVVNTMSRQIPHATKELG